MNRRKQIALVLSIFSLSGLVIGLLALLNIVPMKYVWGGRVTTRPQLLLMETFTFVVNLLILWLIGMAGGYFPSRLKISTLRLTMLLFGIIMFLNTLGNLAAKTNVEKLFAIPTILSATGFWLLSKNLAKNS